MFLKVRVDAAGTESTVWLLVPCNTL